MSFRRIIVLVLGGVSLLAWLATAAAQQGTARNGTSGGASSVWGGQGGASPQVPTINPAPVPTPTISNAPADKPAARDADDKSREQRSGAPSGGRNEFQDFVAQSAGRDLPLFGHNLFADAPSTFAPLERVPVTPDYIVGPGDEILIRAWGQVDIDYRATVDRNGTIHIPQVGTLTVAGLRYQDLNGFLRSAIGRVFRNFDLNVSMGQLSAIQVFVVGQARRPGTYTISSLSTLVNALFASGGPSFKGSMRRIQLKRGNKVVTEFDIYDLLLKGDKSRDVRLLPGDVIYIPPVGQLVAITGSINVPAVYEIKDQASLRDLIEWAGGLATTALGQRATVERIAGRQTRVMDEFMLDPAGIGKLLRDGDLVTIYAVSPRIQNAVSVLGFVAQPARFPWRENLKVRDLLPDREALVSADYWIRRNALVRPDDWIRRPLEALKAPDVDAQRLRSQLRRAEEVNWDYAVIERINPEDLTTQLVPFNLGKAIIDGDPASNLLLAPGDVIVVFSKDDIQVPVERQTKYVRLEGEVRNPGIYQLLPGETLRQLVARVGGVTANAYLFGAEFTRESTRVLQQRRLEEALDRLAQEIERNAAAMAVTATTVEDTASNKLQVEGQRRLLARLRDYKATGRIVLDMGGTPAQMKDLPDLVLEDGDRLLVPPRPSTVGVLGSVYNQNVFLHLPDRRVSDYLAQAGGPTRDADTSRIYVVRADGVVIGGGNSSWLGSVSGERLRPGDTVIVPEELNRFRLSKELRDWAQVFYQFALGVVSLKVLKDL